ncbi:uncharacterized protein E0L32_005156 [Thyridium curvatum]|uniref:Uncharacterized protein n=1 Tax=Thyridium curvatum TaxID=1093900 RepID=A0A507BCS7_9PEZI|nr:uncharacterized protein E0L32_005156 [Thyridium curvatum]TPX14761.1 hypothetical protein E0L32_005156 [Thyridium curvatum]
MSSTVTQAAVPATSLKTGLEVRLAARNKTLQAHTSGLAPSYIQANLIVLPSRYADDFRLLCARNPVPCALIAESTTPGAFASLKSHVRHPDGDGTSELRLAEDIDLRHDFPRYCVYRDGKLAEQTADLEAVWTDDHVGFLVGCSYSFEQALAAAGLPPRQVVQGRNVAMYKTALPLCPAGVFRDCTYVVSMRPYRAADVERVRDLTRPFVSTHGEPVAWGWDGARRLGIEDITRNDWGDQSLRLDGEGPFDESEEGYVPVFWGCGVTPQSAVVDAGLSGTIMAHAPGYMTVLDVRDEDMFPVLRK